MNREQCLKEIRQNKEVVLFFLGLFEEKVMKQFPSCGRDGYDAIQGKYKLIQEMKASVRRQKNGKRPSA